MGLITRSADGSIVRYGLSNADLHVIPNLSAGNVTGGEAPNREDVAFSGVAQKTGRLRPQAVEGQGFAIPDHPSWDDLQTHAEAQTVLWFQFELPGEDNVWAAEDDSVTVGFDAMGKFLLVGGDAAHAQPNNDAFGPGHSFALKDAVDGQSIWPIDRIVASGADAGFYRRKKTAVAAVAQDTAPGGYKIILPKLTRTFRARVANVAAEQAEADGSVTTPLNLAPVGRLPKWVAALP